MDNRHPATVAPEHDTITHRFQAVADCQPDRTALIDDQQTLTYRELRTSVTRIAGSLHSAHPAGAHIALLFEQGCDAIVAMLAVLEAGMSFVQLDAQDPPERLRTIIDDCAVAAIVTSQQYLALARTLRAGIDIIDSHSITDRDPASAITTPTTADSIAYILYTSGSTGLPKGVTQSHGNLLHFVDVYCDRLHISSTDRLSMLYTLGFSAANLDIFSALLRGASLYLYNVRRRGLADLADWIDRQAITVLHTVPTVFRTLVDHLDSGRRLDSIRIIDLGGEAVYPRDAEALRHFSAGCILLNHYAATEASVIAQIETTGLAHDASQPLPVGLPAPGMEIEIHRAEGGLAAVKETGEIVLRSRFLSPGYWNRPELNNATFLPDPHQAGMRLYRTGDAGFIDQDGHLHHRGRLDHRVKIHGQSVCLAEIEAALDRIDWLHAHAVITRGDAAAGERHLVAFLVTGHELTDHAHQLRDQLRQHLPQYMIPQELIFVDSLPMTNTGKIDRRALAANPRKESIRTISSTEPQDLDDVGALVVSLIEKTLKRRIGLSESFFDAGGDSLRAIELHMQLEAVLGDKLDLGGLFHNPTPTGIADYIRDRQAGANNAERPSVLVALRDTGHKPALFLVHGRNAQAFVSPHFLSIVGDDQPVYAFQATGLPPGKGPYPSVSEMVEMYLSAMRDVQPEGPYLLGGLCAGGFVAMEMAARLTAAGEKVTPLLLIDPPPYSPGNLPDVQRHHKRNKLLSEQDARREQQRMRLERRALQGRIDLDPNDQSALSLASETMLNFELALLDHPIRPHPLPVILLMSRQRGEQIMAGRTNLRDKFGQVLDVYIISDAHEGVFDTRNVEFQRALRTALATAHGALAHQPAATTS